MKQAHAFVTSLSARTPREVVGLPVTDDAAPVSSLATLYAELVQPAAAVVAVRLVASLLGTRQLVATAGIPPGFAGIAAIATGIVADSWHAEAYGVLNEGRLHVKLGARECCSGHRVVVPAALQQDVPLLSPLEQPAILPLVRDEGAYDLLDGTDGSEAIEPVERVLRIVATAGAGGPATISGVSNTLWSVPAGETVIAEPRGNLEGPRTITFVGTTYYQIETVR